ncbi:hypothetical protein GE09DRAFT_685846 [Coniochaeta sp. 2T2.1]|nr:hypothetical protein GE09DRAFT_685846 [Coniochaeta sp. 2T2.1]
MVNNASNTSPSAGRNKRQKTSKSQANPSSQSFKTAPIAVPHNEPDSLILQPGRPSPSLVHPPIPSPLTPHLAQPSESAARIPFSEISVPAVTAARVPSDQVSVPAARAARVPFSHISVPSELRGRGKKRPSEEPSDDGGDDKVFPAAQGALGQASYSEQALLQASLAKRTWQLDRRQRRLEKQEAHMKAHLTGELDAEDDALKEELRELNERLDEVTAELEAKEVELEAKEGELNDKDEELESKDGELAQKETEKKWLRERYLALKGRIHVIHRIWEEDEAPLVSWEENNISYVIQDGEDSVPYSVDRVFGPAAPRESFMAEFQLVLSLAEQGTNVVIFNDGYPGPGKQQTLDDILAALGPGLFAPSRPTNSNRTPGRRNLTISYLEIFGDKIYDLLLRRAHQEVKTHKLRNTATIDISALGTKLTIDSAEWLADCISTGDAKRHLHAPHLGHTVLTITSPLNPKYRTPDAEDPLLGSITIINLAPRQHYPLDDEGKQLEVSEEVDNLNLGWQQLETLFHTKFANNKRVNAGDFKKTTFVKVVGDVLGYTPKKREETEVGRERVVVFVGNVEVDGDLNEEDGEAMLSRRIEFARLVSSYWLRIREEW